MNQLCSELFLFVDAFPNFETKPAVVMKAKKTNFSPQAAPLKKKLHRSTFMETFSETLFELFLYCLHWLIAGGLRYEQWTTIKEYVHKLFQWFVTYMMSYSHSWKSATPRRQTSRFCMPQHPFSTSLQYWFHSQTCGSRPSKSHASQCNLKLSC